jgi:hypothetical protein
MTSKITLIVTLLLAVGCGSSYDERRDMAVQVIRGASDLVRRSAPRGEAGDIVRARARALGILAEWAEADFVPNDQRVCGAYGVLDVEVEQLGKVGHDVSPAILWVLDRAAKHCRLVTK